MDEVDESWNNVDSVMEYTDTDLESARRFNSRVYDADHQLRRYAVTLRDELGFKTLSKTLDYALRIELAYGIDSRSLPFTRNEFDVAYTIPPRGWVKRQIFPELEIISEDELDELNDTILYSAPKVCKKMIIRAVESGVYETNTELIRTGIRRCCGHQ